MVNLRKLRDASGKFTKGQAYYVGDAYQKSFRCGNCKHFNADEGKCTLVDHKGSPTPGVISAEGSCSLFNARPPRVQLLQMMWGRGRFDGLAPEVARASAFMLTYTALNETPPEDLKSKAVFTPEQIEKLFPRRNSSNNSSGNSSKESGY